MKIRQICSYDFVLLDTPEVTEKTIKFIKKMQKDTGIFENPVFGHAREDEYPEET